MKSLIGDFSYFSSCFQPPHFKYKLWKCHCSHNVLVLQAWLEGSSQDVFCILCSLVQTSSFVLVWFLWFFFWIPIFEQFDQGSCFVTVMFETCPISGIYKFLITISVVSLHMTVSSLTSCHINSVGFFLKLEKKNLLIFCMFSLLFFPIRNVFYMQAQLPGMPLPSSQTFFNTDIIFIFKISIWAIQNTLHLFT